MVTDQFRKAVTLQSPFTRQLQCIYLWALHEISHGDLQRALAVRLTARLNAYTHCMVQLLSKLHQAFRPSPLIPWLSNALIIKTQAEVLVKQHEVRSI